MNDETKISVCLLVGVPQLREVASEANWNGSTVKKGKFSGSS